MVKEVLLLFKTHLDIGFTDYAGKVIDHYLKVYIPNAIRVGYALKDTDTPFIWSVGSWLLWEALKGDDGTVRRAVEDGVISWHALPFTSYTEMMNRELLEYGLSLSERLDTMFGRKTISAKMSDVPGHTAAMIKPLAQCGVKFLHLGINEASPMPPVPPVFRWRYGEDEVTVMYQVSYGRTMEFDTFAVSFGFTGDNCGPQKAEDITAQYAALRQQYPGAVVRAATLNDVAERICALPDLPVVEKEIGDTWIHGIGTDPKKVSLYRDLLRHIEQYGIGDADLTDNLLLVPEHTWGADLKTFYPEFDTYSVEGFRRLAGTPPRLRIEETWAEQRRYIDRASQVLGAELHYDTDIPDIDGMADVEIPALPFSVSWQLFDRRDYERYKDAYIPHESHSLEWAILDFTKVGIPDYEGGIYDAEPICAWSDGVRTVIRFAFDEGAAAEYGLPVIYAEVEGERLELRWFGQKPLRLPNAYWIRFDGMQDGIQIRKLGEWIDADSIIGSPLICGTDYGARSSEWEVESLDASLAAPYGRRLLEYETQPVGQDLYFNLYNNIWNTNHPMWYSDDARFRFVMHRRR